MPRSMFELQDVDLEKAAAEIGGALREATYAVVGLGVLGFQRAQVRRVALAHQLSEQMGELARTVDEALAPVRREIDGHLDEIEGRLAAPAGDLLHSLRKSAAAGERAVRAAVLKPPR